MKRNVAKHESGERLIRHRGIVVFYAMLAGSIVAPSYFGWGEDKGDTEIRTDDSVPATTEVVPTTTTNTVIVGTESSVCSYNPDDPEFDVYIANHGAEVY